VTSKFEPETATNKQQIIRVLLVLNRHLSFNHLLTVFLAVSKANFGYHYCIGKGGFGKVWKVHRKKNHQPFAMKEMSKARIITKRSVKSVINERQILAQL